MKFSRWVDALLASPISSGTPRYLEHCVLGRLHAWEIAARADAHTAQVPAWWREAVARAGPAPSISACEAWWRPWDGPDRLDLAWNRVHGGLTWVRDTLAWDLAGAPASVTSLCAAADLALAEPRAHPHPEALEAAAEQYLRAAEALLAEVVPATPRRLAGVLHAARRASQGLKSPVTLHVPLSDVRSVAELVRARAAVSPGEVQDAYARVVRLGAQLRDRCAAEYGGVAP
ncbi:MAG: hypothetical protein U0325_03480 [Polyangiales bacterium]